MSKTWFISDTHFGHGNMLNFKDSDGKPIRVFKDVDEMDEEMIKNWNYYISPEDRVYHLGDVAISLKALHKVMPRLNGRKVLLKGNHDIFKLKEYTPYFEDIRAFKVYPAHGIIFSHVPVHPQQLENRFKFNVHGHLHQNNIMKGGIPDWQSIDGRYLNICVEKTYYSPLAFEEVLARLGIEK